MGTFLTILLYGDYAGLVVVFYLCYKWFKKISKSSSSIKQVVDILQKYSKDSMKENYGNLMEEMEKAPYSPIWNKFKRSLFASPSEGVLMTQDPETFYKKFLCRLLKLCLGFLQVWDCWELLWESHKVSVELNLEILKP